MKKLITIIIFIVSLKGFSQERYSHNNVVQIIYERMSNKILSPYQTFNLNSKYDLKTVNFRSRKNHKFIISKVNEYHFAVFQKDLEFTKALGLKIEFQMDKYKNKVALLNIQIPLKI